MTIRWNDPIDDQLTAWQTWLAARPPRVRAVAERFDPWTMYRLTSTGQRARFVGCDVGRLNCDETMCGHTSDAMPDGCRFPFGHDGAHDAEGRVTVRCDVEHATAMSLPDEIGDLFRRQVFGIDPGELVPWTEEDEREASL